jgi:hypothetical protein
LSKFHLSSWTFRCQHSVIWTPVPCSGNWYCVMHFSNVLSSLALDQFVEVDAPRSCMAEKYNNYTRGVSWSTPFSGSYSSALCRILRLLMNSLMLLGRAWHRGTIIRKHVRPVSVCEFECALLAIASVLLLCLSLSCHPKFFEVVGFD